MVGDYRHNSTFDFLTLELRRQSGKAAFIFAKQVTWNNDFINVSITSRRINFGYLQITNFQSPATSKNQVLLSYKQLVFITIFSGATKQSNEVTSNE